jgi:tetratricopeptide (TPR) repeat protein
MDENGVSHINLAYFGQVDPAYYGIDCTHLPGAPTFAQQAIGRPQLPGYVAISPTVLSGVYLQPRWRVFYRPFRDLQPVAIIGNSMRVYWVDTWPIETIRDDVARRDPSELDAHRMLGDALLLAMSWYEPAGAYYRQYLSYRPGDTAALSRFGIALAQAGETAGAIDVFRRVVDLAPDDDRAHQNLARALLHEGHAVEANVHAREAASLNPGDANTHALLARTLAVQQKFREALREFQRAVELDPTHPDAREGLARLNDNLQQVAVR